MLPEFTAKRSFTVEFHVIPYIKQEAYKVIIGRRGLRKLKINIKYEDLTFEWEDLAVPISTKGFWDQANMQYSVNIIKKQLLPANYKQRDIEAVVAKKTQLTNT